MANRTVVAEVVAIGDELTSGQRVDTNSAWISAQLGDMGIRVLYHSTCGDDLPACTAVFAQALARADVVISTGGLGPTADDLTRDAIAAAVGRPLVLDQAVLTHIEQLYRRRGREMPPANRVQALFPEGAWVIDNPHGTAPGIGWLTGSETGAGAGTATGSGSVLFALPGVPAEMCEMWAGTVVGRLRAMFPAVRVIRHHRLKCFGVGESQLEQMLPDLIRRGRSPTVGITVHRATITLRVTAEGVDEQDCQRQMQPTIDTIRTCLGELVFGEEDDELQHAVLRLLRDQGRTLATLEWGTHGLLAHWLREAAVGDMARYLGGLVVGESRLLEGLLGAPLPCPAEATEQEFWETVAAELRVRTGADYGLVVGGIPDALEDTSGQTFWMALATPEGASAITRDLAGHPDIVRERSAKQALQMVRRELLRQSVQS